jgi:thymidylate synthase (FAD)
MIEVTYIDHMGTDLSVVNAARVSFGKNSKWDYIDWRDTDDYARKKILNEGDTKLIKYLAKHRHMSPFGHAFASFHVKAPIFVARQLVKHKFLRWNEISRRYVDDDPNYYYPDEWRGRSADKKQGSEGVVDLSTIADSPYNTAILGSGNMDGHVIEISEWLLETYKTLVRNGVAPEQARMVLPQSTMTEWYWSGSLDAFADMCKLRTTDDTQYETRVAAVLLSNKMLELFPVSWYELLRIVR